MCFLFMTLNFFVNALWNVFINEFQLRHVDDESFQLDSIYIRLLNLFSGYASSSSGGAGLYNSNVQSGTYGSNYPYSNQYTGYASTGAGGFPYQPLPPFASPFDFQNAFQQYYGQLSALNAKYD